MTRHLVHCSYHKCLTVYYKRVMDALLNRWRPRSGGYRHFNSHVEEFYAALGDYRVVSINNRSLDLDRLGEFRISRFLRDPRDLVVSGYFYHKRGVEDWVTRPSPTESDWYFANGCLPEGMRGSRVSFAEYLQSVSEEEGLLAELEFRRLHFESMGEWPSDHPHVLTLRYEDVIGNEVEAFGRIFEFYEMSRLERTLGKWFARRYAVRRRARDTHVRNPASGQWREHFTPRLADAFDSRYGSLVEALGYLPTRA